LADRGDRLRVRAEFTAVQQGGRRVSGRYATIIGMPNALTSDRLGIIASKRVGNAVVRNRAKRRLREIFRRRPVSVTARRIDVVAIARPETVTAPFAAVEKEIGAAIVTLRGAR
jgi:ribonuclease P protein component